MTHSIKVAQVGRRLVQYLEYESRNRRGIEVAGGIDRNVVTAAGLLHDVGHPPFGHIGEQQLNQLARSYRLTDGFEGNAQTLRIMLSLTAHQPSKAKFEYGLDLTLAVIAACVKYPWSSEVAKEQGKNKWGYYEPDAEEFEKYVAPLLPAPGVPTLEAEIMDWADDITYAVHDIQDYYTDGIIPLHHLRHNQNGSDYVPVNYNECSDFWEYASEKLRQGSQIARPEAKKHFAEFASEFPDRHFRRTREESAKMGALASRIITAASKATTVTPQGRLYVEPVMRSVIGALKQITWYYVIDHPDLVATQIGQRCRINQAFNKLYKRVEFCFKQRGESGELLTPTEQWMRKRRLPAPLREFTEQLLSMNHNQGAYDQRRQQCYARGVIDYIASMTEVEFDQSQQRHSPVENYEKLRDGDFYRGDEGV